MAVIGIVISGIHLSFSQSGNGSGLIPDNETNSSNMSMPDVSDCPRNMPCKDLPPRCVNCSFSESCTYGNNTTVMCTPLEGVQCEVKFSKSLMGFCSTLYMINVIMPK